MRKVLRASLPLVALSLLMPLAVLAENDMIKSAASAAPPSISDKATILSSDGKVLREGTNGWTCMPDRPDTPGNDPMCVDKRWLNLLQALKSKKEPSTEGFGISYMLAGDSPVSNTDPYATKPTSDADWVEDAGPHLMIALEKEVLKKMTTDPYNGGPWVMWKDTPYAHLMVPLEHGPK